MNIHEYQAKSLLREFNIPVPRGEVAFSVNDAIKAAKNIGGNVHAVKAQIHAGGRGKGGGIKIVKSEYELKQAAERILNMTLITHQTGKEGQIVRKIYIEEATNIKQEFYLSCLVDRASGYISFIASTEGGMDIEHVAKETPDKIETIQIDPAVGCAPYIGRRVAHALKLKGETAKQCAKMTHNIYNAFIKKDMSLLEINPLALTRDDTIICLDAKIGFDDNALWKHKDITELRDADEENEKEKRAAKYDLSYVALNGNIGCMVNGAGLAMATMDIIQLYGGKPANFLDVGGGATKEKVAAAFAIITEDPNVKAILVNIFGGIMKCDIIAEGIIDAVKETGLNTPLIVRLEGTNADIAKNILENSKLPITSAITLDDAAQKAVNAIHT